MAITKALSNPSVEIDDNPISIIPNSLSFKYGKGDKSVKTQSAGGNSIESILTEDAETKISMVKFKLRNTNVNLNLANTWTANVDGMTIRLSEGDMSVSFRNMVVVTEPEVAIGADGELELEFQGQAIL